MVLWRTQSRPTVPSSVTGTLSHRCDRCTTYQTGVLMYYTGVPGISHKCDRYITGVPGISHKCDRYITGVTGISDGCARCIRQVWPVYQKGVAGIPRRYDQYITHV